MTATDNAAEQAAFAAAAGLGQGGDERPNIDEWTTQQEALADEYDRRRESVR